ncbi:hypothetical protein DM02DRAFT_687942 [Periconia macrospinosa]|uniref:DUF7580 domain-containing protein n=1 Tax=Periconia macrospinosa TaxID=97972 RepID=A0A2V1DDX2_9PLEO|nr:hypothetical protein DM02DRAFT_687942 [Periconia macrospinosa]
MSGVEIAGLAIGIVPIVIEIIKAYRSTRDHLQTFTHHVQVVQDVRLRYRVAATNFTNDCQLLLEPVVEDAGELYNMVDDPKHEGWTKPSLEERFREFLDRDYETCEQIVVHIRDVLRKTQSRLEALRNINDEPGTLKRLHQAFNVAIKENEYRRSLDELDQWNIKLGLAAALKRFADTRVASQGLYKSLHESWTCTNISHVGHQAKLSLDAHTENGSTQLDIVIACHRRDPLHRSQKADEAAPIWLHVQSITTEESGQDVNKPSLSLVDSPTTPFKSEIPVSPPISSSPSSKGFAKQAQKRARSAKSPEPPQITARSRTKIDAQSEATTDAQGLSFVMQDLKAIPSFCCHLNSFCLTAVSDSCLGYLETRERPTSFKFVFYDAGQLRTSQITGGAPHKVSHPVGSILGNLQILHQLKMAHRLAEAVLRFYSTSWFSPDWNLNDVSCFGDVDQSSDIDVSKTLDTLHLSTRFPTENPNQVLRKPQDPNQLNSLYGIRNLALAKLGVALLEIGCRKDITDFDTDIAPHHVVTARKILLERPSVLDLLGRKYIKITRQCIDCDFSCGEDLNDESLRGAVYTDVICTLEDLIRKWEDFFN